MRVLVVHHDRWARLVLVDVLARAGFGVAEASNGMTALRLAAQTRPDVVVLGTRLPELAAHDVQTALKAAPATRRIGVFVLRERVVPSGCAVPACVRRCQRVVARGRATRVSRRRIGTPARRRLAAARAAQAPVGE
ncbi:MAG TPA: response regulator [Chloroflexota bacterium]|jgi:CheY-like chemotaxis protein